MSKKHGFVTVLLLLVFVFDMKAQMPSPRFYSEGAVHDEDFSLGVDWVQARANAFIYEGKHDKFYKWEFKKYHKKKQEYKAFSKKIESIHNEGKRDSLYTLYKYKSQSDRSIKVTNPYPRHNYVVIIAPSFSPTCGFAVGKEKLIYMEMAKHNLQKPNGKYKVTSLATEVQPELCKALRSLMDNIVNSARVSTNSLRTLDGITYNIIVGNHPTHMVSSNITNNKTKGAVLELLQKLCDAAKNNDADIIKAQLPEIQRLDSIYYELR